MTDYARPSFAELNARIQADLALIPAPLAWPLAAMWARACHSQHAHLDWILKQCSPLTCDLERLYDWALLYSVDRLLPVAAQGAVMATGNVGTIVLADSLLRAPNGFDYRVLSATTLGVSATAVTVRCTTTGATTNLSTGQVLTLIDPIDGCNSQMTVGTLGLTGGADEETVDAWRLRVVEEWQSVVLYGGRAGKVADYKAWAMAAHPSVTGALVQPQAMGPGTVLVRPICNNLTNRLPTQTILDAVLAYFPGIVPAVADFRVAAPNVQSVAIELELSPSTDTLANRNAIQTVLINAVLSKQDNNARLLMTEIDAAILSVVSGFTRLAPLVDITAATGAILVASVAFD